MGVRTEVAPNDHPNDRKRPEELALVSQEATIAVVSAIASSDLGPAGAAIGALMGPFASLAAKRLRELV